MKNRFYKGHGLGNDYIVLDPAELTFTLTPGRIALLCDRERGIGSDGVLTLESSEAADFGMRTWNPDGSEAEISGNGLRIFACYLHATDRTQKRSFSIETPGRCVQVELHFDDQGVGDAADCGDTVQDETNRSEGSAADPGNAGKADLDDAGEADLGDTEKADQGGKVRGDTCEVTVQMGRASFDPKTLPCTIDVDELTEQPISAAGETLTFTGVSVGNPHCVIFKPVGESWSRDDLLRLGPALATHTAFPLGTNVQLATPSGPHSITILIWERGAGETTASGSSACAVASAVVRLGLVTSPVTVESPGGALLVDVDERFNLTLSGPVGEVARGTLSTALVQALAGHDNQPQFA